MYLEFSRLFQLSGARASLHILEHITDHGAKAYNRACRPLYSAYSEATVEKPFSTMSGTGLRVAGGIAKKTGAKKAAGVSGELHKHV